MVCPDSRLLTLQSGLRLLAMLLFLPAITVQAETHNWASYLVDGLNFTDPARKAEFEVVRRHLDNQAYAEAEKHLQTFLAQHEEGLRAETPVAYAKALSNLGIIKAQLNEQDEALATLDDSIHALESSQGPFYTGLVKPLMAKGLIQESMENYSESEDVLRRAQHIIHRHDGVYSPRQVPMVDQLTVVKIKKGEMLAADRQQKFNLKIHEQIHGRHSEEMISVLQDLGAYFARRGDMIPLQSRQEYGNYRDELFRESVSLYERAIDIIENKYRQDDIRLVEPLRGLAKARILQVTGRRYAEDALERVAEIVQNSSGSDLPDYVRALVDLADAYVVTNDSKAEETYLKAWNLLADKPELADLRNELFGTPKRLHPSSPGVVVLDRRPYDSDEDEDLYVDAEYTVRANGRVTDVNVIDGNVPNQERRSVRHLLTQTRFRPRIVDGELTQTSGLMLHQPFIVEEKKPEKDVSFSVTTGRY